MWIVTTHARITNEKQNLSRKYPDRSLVAMELLCRTAVCALRALMGRAHQPSRRKAMAKMWTGIVVVAAVVASFLLVAPVIESGTSGSTQLFQAVGTADGGAD